MKTSYYGYKYTPKASKDKFEYDWLDYKIANDIVRDIRPFMIRKTIPSGCCCIRDAETHKIKCRYYNDNQPIVRCELLNIDSTEYVCLKHAIKVCNEPHIDIIKPYVEVFG
jgi:hypothetical protein